MKFNRKKRAISYIMEVVMMTLVVTALASVVLTWGISTITSSRVSLTGAVNARMDRLQEGLIIEDVQMIRSGYVDANTPNARVWLRNTGSIQIVVDQIYFNSFNAPIKFVCRPGSPGETPSGLPVAQCPTSATKLSLPIQAVGAVDVVVPPTVAITVTSGTVSSAMSSTLSDATKGWSTNQFASCTVSITAGLGAGPTLYAITSNIQTQVTIIGLWSTTPNTTSQYVIATAGMCGGGTYTVTSATSRGTTTQGSFTV